MVSLHYMILILHALVTTCGHSVQAFSNGSQLFALVTLDVIR